MSIAPPLSITRVLAHYRMKPIDLATHLGVTGHSLKQWERGNLEMSPTVRRFLALLVDVWERDGYKEPGEFWGAGWE